MATAKKVPAKAPANPKVKAPNAAPIQLTADEAPAIEDIAPAPQDELINTTPTEPLPSQPENGQGNLPTQEGGPAVPDTAVNVPPVAEPPGAEGEAKVEDQENVEQFNERIGEHLDSLPPGDVMDIPEEFKEKAERYKKMYPTAKSIFVTSDGQVFLGKNKADAKFHQNKINKTVGAVEIPL